MRSRQLCSARALSFFALLAVISITPSFADDESAPTPSSETPPARPAETENTPAPEPAPAAGEPSPDELFDVGRALFDQYAPSDIKAAYEYPSKKQWDEFVVNLNHALQGNSFRELASYEPQARSALSVVRSLPGYEEYADWLAERIDLIDAAERVEQSPRRQPGAPGSSPRPQPVFAMPHYELWLQRLSERPTPPGAAELIPMLRTLFAAEGIPPELVWIAEVESTFNPLARSPAGARGLFQLMPATAKALGLSVFLPDERTDPEKNARAAARLLGKLHARFGEWPLALAAYNAGEGRVRRALAAQKAKTFAEIAPVLPVETRLYVPKVYATMSLRTGLPPEKLAAPDR